MGKDSKNLKPGIVYRLFRAYVKFVHNKFFYKKVYIINRENAPKDGTPLLITSNHQNCLNDPLGIVFSFSRKVHAMTRADVFKNPLAAKFLRWIGLVPAFRMMDGAETLSNNGKSFDTVETELLEGKSIIIYPEAGHQDKRWLGDFSLGYMNIAFGAAKRSNYEKEIFVLPSCNHYDNYFHIRNEILIKYGTPVSLKPFYELHKTKPRTAQREANKLVRQQIESLMLNITDLENYEAIDYIRNTYGKEYAQKNGFDAKNLNDKLLSDKKLFEELETLKQTDEATVKEIYAEAMKLKKGTYELNVRDWNFTKPFSAVKSVLCAICFIALLPLYIFAMYPYLPMFYAPRAIMKKNMDPMFINTLHFGMSVLVTIPIFFTLSFFLCKIITNSYWIALIYLLTLPIIGLFAWEYRLKFIKWKAEIKFNWLKNSEKVKNLTKTRERLFDLLRKNIK